MLLYIERRGVRIGGHIAVGPHGLPCLHVECRYATTLSPKSVFQPDEKEAELRRERGRGADPIRLERHPFLFPRLRVERVDVAVVCSEIDDSLVQDRGRKNAFSLRVEPDVVRPRNGAVGLFESPEHSGVGAHVHALFVERGVGFGHDVLVARLFAREFPHGIKRLARRGRRLFLREVLRAERVLKIVELEYGMDGDAFFPEVFVVCRIAEAYEHPDGLGLASETLEHFDLSHEALAAVDDVVHEHDLFARIDISLDHFEESVLFSRFADVEARSAGLATVRGVRDEAAHEGDPRALNAPDLYVLSTECLPKERRAVVERLGAENDVSDVEEPSGFPEFSATAHVRRLISPHECQGLDRALESRTPLFALRRLHHCDSIPSAIPRGDFSRTPRGNILNA